MGVTRSATQLRNATSLADRTAHRRAVELTIWGMPAVSMAAIRASLKRDLDADFGDIVYFSKVMEPRHEFLTANNQTPYVLHRASTSGSGPMVLEVPPATDKTVFFGSAIDSWEVPLADIGGTGDDAGKGGKYLFLPPGDSGKPPDGYFVVPSATVFIHIALAPDHHRQGHARRRRRLQPAAESLSAGRRREARDALHRRLPESLEDAADVRRELFPAARRRDRRRAAAGEGRRHAGDAGEHRHREGQAVPARRDTRRAPDRRRARGRSHDELLLHEPRPGAVFGPDANGWATKPENNFSYSYYGNGVLDYHRRAPRRLPTGGHLGAEATGGS